MAGSDTVEFAKVRLRVASNPDRSNEFFKWAVRGRVFSFEQDEQPDDGKGPGYKFTIRTFHIEAKCLEDAIDAARFHVKQNLKLKGFFTLSVKCENLPLK